MKMENLTESEELVMKAIWDCHKEPVLSDVVDRVNDFYGKTWRPQTVSTFLSKLVRKNYIEMQRDGKIYTYKVLVPEREYKRKLYKHLISFWYDNSSKKLIEDMFLKKDLELKHIAKLTGSDNLANED